MILLYALLVAAGLFCLARIFLSVRKLRGQRESDSWDEEQLKRLRAQGSDPFSPHSVDFFFALPNEAACQAVRGQLEPDGFSVDLKSLAHESQEQPFSLHASKSMRLSAPIMRDLSRRFGEIARANGGRYDGWAAEVVPQKAESGPLQ